MQLSSPIVKRSGKETELSVRCNRHSPLVWLSASSLVLVGVIGSMSKIHYQVSQSNSLDGRGLGKELSKIPDKKLAKTYLQYVINLASNGSMTKE